jgi:hypothetical protein
MLPININPCLQGWLPPKSLLLLLLLLQLHLPAVAPSP